MRLVTFVYRGETRLGALRSGGTGVVDLNRAEPRLPTDMLAMLQGGADALGLAGQALDSAPAAAEIDLRAVTLKAPIQRPGKLICIGLNYRDHAAESHVPVTEYPTVFAKFANTVIGPDESIVLPRSSDQVDYEAELAVVLGRCARNVAEPDALGYVAGYMPFNDISARDWQMRTTQWTLGKSFDSFAPTGPALVTADDVPDPQALDLQLTIGGAVLQRSNTRNMIFGVAFLVAYLSTVMTLEPGDVIATGTPSGVGAARTPPRFLRAGEVVEVTIGGLGTLSNPIVAAPG